MRTWPWSGVITGVLRPRGRRAWARSNPVLPGRSPWASSRSRQMVPGDRAALPPDSPREMRPRRPSPGAGGPAQHRTGQRQHHQQSDNNITARTLEEGPGWSIKGAGGHERFQRFSPGRLYLISQENFDRFVAGRDTIGRPDGQFMAPKGADGRPDGRYPNDVGPGSSNWDCSPAVWVSTPTGWM